MEKYFTKKKRKRKEKDKKREMKRVIGQHSVEDERREEWKRGEARGRGVVEKKGWRKSSGSESVCLGRRDFVKVK